MGTRRFEMASAIGLRHPASASCLGRHLRLAGRCPNNSSLFPPLLTGLDEANILMAMCASRQTEQCKVVAKINRRSLMDLVSSEGIIDSVVSARDVTTELIVQYVRAMEGAAGSQIKTLHRLVEGAVEALEFHVDRDPDLVNVPLRELKLRSGVLIAGIVRRDGEIVIPGGNDTIRAGDDVIVVTQDTALQELRDILRQG